jgi:hypothetical protein
MGMFVRGDFIALVGMLVIGEPEDCKPTEGQSQILKENGLWFLFLHSNGLDKKNV